ncbi:MAG: HAMP domain-containing protein [Candidatus Methylomirabilales bacterium]
MGRRPERRRRFYVHQIQRKYLFLSLVPLIICSFLIIVFLFIPLDVLLYSSASPAAKRAIVQDLRTLGIRIWPAIFLAMLASCVLSVFVTHRFAGPLYRFQQVADRIAAGDLSIRFKLRKGDDLLDLEAALSRAIETMAGTIRETQRLLTDLTHRLEGLRRRAGEGQRQSLDEDLTGLLEDAGKVQAALSRLRTGEEMGG